LNALTVHYGLRRHPQTDWIPQRSARHGACPHSGGTGGFRIYQELHIPSRKGTDVAVSSGPGLHCSEAGTADRVVRCRGNPQSVRCTRSRGRLASSPNRCYWFWQRCYENCRGRCDWMAETMVHGASAIEAVIAEHFLEHDVLITLWYGDTVVAQFLSTIDDTEIQHDSEEIDTLTDEEADGLPNEAWDRRSEERRVGYVCSYRYHT